MSQAKSCEPKSTDKLAKAEYSQLLDRILRTNPQKKAAKLMERAMGVKCPKITIQETPDASPDSDCSLSKSIKYNKCCIENIQTVRDNLLSAFMMSSELGKTRKDEVNRSLLEGVGNIINLVSEAVTLSRKINENAMGLLVAVDFLRSPKDLEILNFSRTGRIPISHFSCNEATAMCLTWLCNSAENLMKNYSKTDHSTPSCGIATTGNFHDSMQKIYLGFQDAIFELKDSALLASQVFRVLLYCNSHGKEMLKEYVLAMKRDEINDIILEIQTLRRQFDEITILFEKLGWSLADIWTRCTGTSITFESLHNDGFLHKEVGKAAAAAINSSTAELKTKSGTQLQGSKTDNKKISESQEEKFKNLGKTKKDAKFLLKLGKLFGRRVDIPGTGLMKQPSAVSSQKKPIKPAPKLQKYKTYGHGLPKVPKKKVAIKGASPILKKEAGDNQT